MRTHACGQMRSCTTCSGITMPAKMITIVNVKNSKTIAVSKKCKMFLIQKNIRPQQVAAVTDLHLTLLSLSFLNFLFLCSIFSHFCHSSSLSLSLFISVCFRLCFCLFSSLFSLSHYLLVSHSLNLNDNANDHMFSHLSLWPQP